MSFCRQAWNRARCWCQAWTGDPHPPEAHGPRPPTSLSRCSLRVVPGARCLRAPYGRCPPRAVPGFPGVPHGRCLPVLCPVLPTAAFSPHAMPSPVSPLSPRTSAPPLPPPRRATSARRSPASQSPGASGCRPDGSSTELPAAYQAERAENGAIAHDCPCSVTLPHPARWGPQTAPLTDHAHNTPYDTPMPSLGHAPFRAGPAHPSRNTHTHLPRHGPFSTPGPVRARSLGSTSARPGDDPGDDPVQPPRGFLAPSRARPAPPLPGSAGLAHRHMATLRTLLLLGLLFTTRGQRAAQRRRPTPPQSALEKVAAQEGLNLHQVRG